MLSGDPHYYYIIIISVLSFICFLNAGSHLCFGFLVFWYIKKVCHRGVHKMNVLSVFIIKMCWVSVHAESRWSELCVLRKIPFDSFDQDCASCKQKGSVFKLCVNLLETETTGTRFETSSSFVFCSLEREPCQALGSLGRVARRRPKPTLRQRCTCWVPTGDHGTEN